MNHDNGYQVHVSQNIEKPMARYLSICYTAPKTGWKTSTGCRAHVKAVGPNRDELTIVSLDTNHTCGSLDIRRKRNYLTRDISDVSEVLGIYQPTASKEGNAKQLIEMTRKATGVTIKKGQATLAVRSKSNDSIEAKLDSTCSFLLYSGLIRFPILSVHTFMRIKSAHGMTISSNSLAVMFVSHWPNIFGLMPAFECSFVMGRSPVPGALSILYSLQPHLMETTK